MYADDIRFVGDDPDNLKQVITAMDARGVVKVVTDFQYLGSICSAGNTVHKDVNNRLAKTGNAWQTLTVTKVWSNLLIPKSRFSHVMFCPSSGSL